MSLKNKQTKLNETVTNTKKSVYFFGDRKSKKQPSVTLKTKKNLKSNKPTKYSTVFILNKDILTNTENEVLGSNNAQIQTLELAKQKVEVQNKNKTKWFNVVFFAINIIVFAVVLTYQSKTFGVMSLDVLINNARFGILFYTLLLFVIVMCFETLRTHILLYRATKQTRLFLCYKGSALCRYYDCITPFATGGQAFEIFYLNSRGVHGGIASSVSLTKSIFNNVSFIIISLTVLICNSKIFGPDQSVIITWGIISLCVSCCLLLALILFGISKKMMPKLLMFVLKVGAKLKIVKNPNVVFNKYMRTIIEYQKSTRYYMSNVWVTVSSVLCSGVIVILKALIPFVLYCAFRGSVSDQVLLEIFSKFILVELATKYIPIPGSSGVAEISFSALFASLFKDGTLFWAMLFWRVLNYFIYLFQGLVILVYDFIYGNKKNNIVKQKYIRKKK